MEIFTMSMDSITGALKDGDFSVLGLGVLGLLLKIIAVIVIAMIALRFSGILIERLLRVRKTDTINIDEKKVNTLRPLLKSILRYIVYFIAGVTVLRILGIPTESILATAGIGGLAVGFGAQNLVKDVISGFFILFEEQFSVGDYISTGGLKGIVEEMGLRVTKLRDFSGELHIIPNGEISKVTNHTRGSMRALVDVSVAYEEDIDKAIQVLKKICDEMAEEYEDIIEGPTVLGVVDLGASEVVIRIIAKTVPLQQWSIERELRRRIKNTFDKAGIEIPYPRRVIISRQENKNGGGVAGEED